MLSLKTASTYLLVALLTAAASAGIALLVSNARSGSPGVEILIPTPTSTPDLKVYVSGAVSSPGVYVLREGDRLEDAVAAASGATQGAQLPCINLALRVQDEAQVHVPGAEEPCQPSSDGAIQDDARVDLNTATAEELKSLPGIGDVKAGDIIAYRESNGPFSSAEQIIEVRGIGEKTYESIRDLVRVSGGGQ